MTISLARIFEWETGDTGFSIDTINTCFASAV